MMFVPCLIVGRTVQYKSLKSLENWRESV